MEFSRDGTHIVTMSGNTATVWNALDGHELAQLQGHTDDVTSASFDPSGNRVITTSLDGLVIVWDSISGQELHTFDREAEFYTAAAFGPDDARIALGNENGLVSIQDGQTYEPLGIQIGLASSIETVAFLSDGKQLIAVSDQIGAEVWDLETERMMITIPDVAGELYLSPDGTRIASTSRLGVSIWDSQTGREIVKITGDGAIVSAELSSDGSTLAVVFTNEIFQTPYRDEDNTVRVWDVSRLTQPMETLVDFTCRNFLLGEERHFSNQEIAADPLISDVSEYPDERRDICSNN